MVTISTLCKYISERLDVASFDDICINGLQVEGTRPISFVATAVSPSLFAIEEAAKLGAELLLTHHGLFLKNTGIALCGSMSKRVRSLYRADMHLLSYHLPLDAHKELGNAWPILQELGCTALEPFGKFQNSLVGVQGFCQKISQEKLFEWLQKKFGSQGVTFGSAKKSIQSIAFVSGGGHRLLQEALNKKVDCYITGTTDENIWSLAREEDICVMAFGHYATEKTGIQLLGDAVKKQFQIELRFIQEENPF